MGLWWMLTHPGLVYGQIMMAQLWVESMVEKMEPERIIRPLEDRPVPILKLEDLWQRPLKLPLLYFRICRLGIVKAVEIELEKMQLISTSKLGEELSMERAVQIAMERWENRHNKCHHGN